ncbi:tRNA-dihydrouridine synthase C [Piscinibacter sakaiensis]|uniref:tRNA-dihydrouridine(16) synthase n=1 Tax=Piscinibacter sakaiensis TaxID=1547922 RepID=A0A0K8NT45_PISS1|nr:tRNA-dihydrouridine synthase C [Piscinibacter sakaiensis]
MTPPGSAAPLLLLAPMEGLLDFMLRDVLTRVGGIDRCVSEFIRVTGTLLPNKVFLRIVPELANGGRTPAGVPVRAQLLGSDPACLADNAARLAALGPAGIDLNFGCPAKVVNRHGGGATLLDEPERVGRILAAVRAAVPPAMPVSAKMRLGVRDDTRAVENALALAEAGAAELVVHARTKLDGYRPPAYWDRIAALREAVRVPVIANGEIWSVADARRCRAESGCSGLMLGRGMVADPGLALDILQAAGDGAPARPALDWAGLQPLLAAYWALVSRHIEPRHRAGRVKQWLHHLRRRHPQAEAAYLALRTENDPARLAAALGLPPAEPARPRSSGVEEERRIHHRPVQADGEVQVRAGDAAGGADVGDAVAGRDPVTRAHVRGAQVAAHRQQAAAVVQPDGAAVEEVVADVEHHA